MSKPTISAAATGLPTCTPHPRSGLSFYGQRERTPWNPSDRSCWAVRTPRNHAAGCTRGAAFGREALAHMKAHHDLHLIGHIVLDMIETVDPASAGARGLIVGLFEQISADLLGVRIRDC